MLRQRGTLTCPTGVGLNLHVQGVLVERFPDARPRGPHAEVGRRPGRFYCPGCGVPLPEEMCCPQCGRSIRDLLSQLTELHPHPDEPLTETEWHTCTEPERMLAHLRGRCADRKLRLFACACCCRLGDVLPDGPVRRAVEVLERWADGRGSAREVREAVAAAEAAEQSSRGRVRAAARAVGAAWSTAEHACSAAAQASSSPEAERGRQADLLREVAGNPFRPVPVDLDWLTRNGGRVERVARAIYDRRSFADLPVLADALEEAGCANETLLAHCRSESVHVPGCWALDTLLGVPVVPDAHGEPRGVITLVRPTEQQGRYVRQTSCPGHFAVVTLRVEPYPGLPGVVFLNAAGADPRGQQWVPSVEEGVRQFLEEQAERGQRVGGLRVILTALADHPVDSRARSFECAAALALSEAVRQGGVPSE